MKEKIDVLLIEDNSIDALVVQEMLEHDEGSAFKVPHVSTLKAGMGSLVRGFENGVSRILELAL